MTVKNLDADNSEEETFDIIAMLTEKMTEAEREELAQENASYVQARNARLALAAANGNGRARCRQRPENFKRLQAAIRSQDALATEAAWDSCERWLIADLPTDLIIQVANKQEQPNASKSPRQNVCVPSGALLH